MKFDGCEVEPIKFIELKQFQRFFTDNGEGYCKHSENSCVNDYSLTPIYIDKQSIVFIKTKPIK